MVYASVRETGSDCLRIRKRRQGGIRQGEKKRGESASLPFLEQPRYHATRRLAAAMVGIARWASCYKALLKTGNRRKAAMRSCRVALSKGERYSSSLRSSSAVSPSPRSVTTVSRAARCQPPGQTE